MKKIIVTLFLSLSVFAENNQLTNPGFSSKLTGWSRNGSATTVYGSNFRTGPYAARVGTASSTLYQTLTQKLSANEKHLLTFYAKLSSGTARR